MSQSILILFTIRLFKGARVYFKKITKTIIIRYLHDWRLQLQKKILMTKVTYEQSSWWVESSRSWLVESMTPDIQAMGSYKKKLMIMHTLNIQSHLITKQDIQSESQTM